jgi:hypothetical protein
LLVLVAAVPVAVAEQVTALQAVAAVAVAVVTG